MGARALLIYYKTFGALAWAMLLSLASCGGAGTEPATGGIEESGSGGESDSSATETEAEAQPEAEAEPEAEPSPWLSRLQEEGMLTYRVEQTDGEATEVRMLVQQRVTQGGNIAVRLVAIGTPLGETPIYPQWLIGTPESMSALDEGASFTTPGFVPIDERGHLRTEAAGNEVWRVETRWLRAGGTASGEEVSVGWTLRERVGTIEEPIAADDCVRLDQTDDTHGSTILVCAGVGVVERTESSGGETVSSWRLIAVGERPAELE